MYRIYFFLVLLTFFHLVSAQKKLKDKIIFIDTHNDVLSKQLINKADLAIDQPDLNFDLPKALKGNLAAQVFSVWCDEAYGKGQAFARANREIDSLMSLIKRNPTRMSFVNNSKQLSKALKQHRFAAMIGVEGGHMIEERMDYLDSLIKRGLKYLTLTWNNSTSWATSARDEVLKKDSLQHLGLTDMGRQIVARLNAAGVMVDVSHVGEKTFWDVIATSAKPVIASHSCAWTLTPHRRNLKDDQLKAIAENGGVVFLNFYSGFLDSTFEPKKNAFLAKHKQELDSLMKMMGEVDLASIRLFYLYPLESNAFRPQLSQLVKHIDYIVKLVGVDHVGIGADFDGAESFPIGMNDVSDYPNLVTELKKIGYSNQDIKKIASKNFMRVLKANER